MSDENLDSERMPLLEHLGDVVEAIHCVTFLSGGYETIGQAVAAEDSLADLMILDYVSTDMTPDEFVKAAAGSFYLWPHELLKPVLNRQILAYTVMHDLFADNLSGWTNYCRAMQVAVPWFGIGLK